MSDAANLTLTIRKGRTFERSFQLKDAVINGDPVVRNVTEATFVMQFRDVRGGAVSDLTPVYAEIDLALGSFKFTATDTLTDAMTTTEGTWEVEMTLGAVVTTEFEGFYTVTLPVVQ